MDARTVGSNISFSVNSSNGSCIGQWADGAITISFGIISSLLITLLTLTQCTVIVCGVKKVQLKRVAFSLLVIWIYSSMWGIFSYIIFAVEGNSFFVCELVEVNEARNETAVLSIVLGISSFVLIEVPLPVIIIISTTTSCIKYSKSKIQSRNNESLTRKMIL